MITIISFHFSHSTLEDVGPCTRGCPQLKLAGKALMMLPLAVRNQKKGKGKRPAALHQATKVSG